MSGPLTELRPDRVGGYRFEVQATHDGHPVVLILRWSPYAGLFGGGDISVVEIRHPQPED